MKKIRYIIILSGLGLLSLFGSCSLDEYNPTSVSAEQTLSEFDNWLGYQSMCYQALAPNTLITRSFPLVTEGGTDLWFAPKNGLNDRKLLYYESLDNNDGNCENAWKSAYGSIQQCNDAIRLATNVVNGKPEDMKVLIAEARFLRAYYYSVLVTYFGNITLMTEDTPPTTSPVRSTYEELYGQMISDLKSAATDLGVKSYQDNPARPNKKAALGILARVYAQGAGLNLTEDGKSYWQRAKEVADDLITNAASYDAYLYTDFEDVFAQNNNRINRESLFKSVGTNPLNQSAMSSNGNGQNMPSYFWCRFDNAQDFFGVPITMNSPYTFYGRVNDSRLAPSKYLIDCFDARYDKRWENSFTTAMTTHSFQQAYSHGKTNMPNQKPYEQLIVTIKEVDSPEEDETKKDTLMISQYQLDPSLAGRKIYPYVDLDWQLGYAGASVGQTPAKVWPKGEHSGDVSKLIEVKNVYSHPYPLDVDEDRFAVYLSKDYLSAADKAQRGYLCINIDDLFDPTTGQYRAATTPLGYTGTKDLMMIFPMLSKYFQNFMGSNVANSQQRAGDVMIMRMAEIYLIAAEATLKSGGSGAETAAYLNVLRQRACRNAADFNTTTGMQLTTADMDDVFDEYARELCGENHRWALLRRHDALSARLQLYNKRAYDSYITNPAKYNLRPIRNTFFGQIDNPEEYGNNGY
jgi:hypothetical protein